jgi:long-chain fatty acid transport protein
MNKTVKRLDRITTYSAIGAISLLISSATMATTIGSDTNIKFSQTSAAMGGVGYVRPQDASASVFGNPATLTQLGSDTDFTFGALYANVDISGEGDGSDGLPTWDGDIETEKYLFPTVAVRQRITDDLVLGGGLQVVSGLGADYRNSHPLAPTVTFLTFGANAAAAYNVSPQTTVGASVTLAYGLLEIGLLQGTGMQETFGLRAGLGITHDLGPVMLSANYNSKLTLDFNQVAETTPGNFNDLTLEQPQEVIIGIATTDKTSQNFLVEANIIYKNWDNARLYEDIWKDTYTFQLGGQYNLTNKLKLRAGYSYTTDLLKENGLGSSVGKLNSLAAGGATVPLNPALVQLVQATLADPLWNHNATAGLGYDLTDTITADLNIGYGWGSDTQIGANRVETAVFTGGAGLTWKF